MPAHQAFSQSSMSLFEPIFRISRPRLYGSFGNTVALFGGREGRFPWEKTASAPHLRSTPLPKLLKSGHLSRLLKPLLREWHPTVAEPVVHVSKESDILLRPYLIR